MKKFKGNKIHEKKTKVKINESIVQAKVNLKEEHDNIQ